MGRSRSRLKNGRSFYHGREQEKRAEQGAGGHLVFRSVVAEDAVADLRDVLAAVSRELHRAACFYDRGRIIIRRVAVDADGVCEQIVLHGEVHRPADVAELAVVAPADAVRLDLDGLAVHDDLLAGLLRRERRTRDRAGNAIVLRISGFSF